MYWHIDDCECVIIYSINAWDVVTYWHGEFSLFSSKCFTKKYICATMLKRNVERRLSMFPQNTAWTKRNDP